MDKKNILITGSNGLLGNRLLSLLAGKYNIYALCHNEPLKKQDNINYIVIDLSSDWSVEVFPKNIDTIIHLAQSSKFRDFPDSALDVFDVNVTSTAKLLNFAAQNNVCRFIYASSGGVYGSDKKAFEENSPIQPSDQLGYYLSSKLCGEILARNYSQILDVVTLRFFFMYGAEQNETMLIPRLVNNVREGNPVTLQGDSGIRINPIHVSDAAAAVEHVLDLKGSYIFNIAGKEVLSLKEICEIIGDVFEKTPKFKFVDGQPNDLIANISGMEKNLHIPSLSFKEAIKEFL